jgi:hypothetical protein
MHNAVDARGVDLQPKRGHNTFSVVFFVIYMIVSHVFILNLFVGVIIEQFNSNNEQIEGYVGKNTKQRKWIDI